MRHLVFCHQNYPAQFGPILPFLLKNYEIKLSFLSQFQSRPALPGVQHLLYQPAKTGHEDSPYFFSNYFEKECSAMHGLYQAFHQAGLHKQADTLIGHTAFGTLGLFHVEYPDLPKIGFFELFYNPFEDSASGRFEYPTPKPNRIRVPLRNATQLVELEYCQKGYSPTAFQKSTFPKAYQPKLSVLFDGVDTEFYQPGLVTAQSELTPTWPTGAKIITFVSRGLEAMRGFDLFMTAAHRVSKKRDDVHFVVAGQPKTHYGSEMLVLQESSFKDFVLKQHPYDLNRFHFLDWISEPALRDLFRLSVGHFYWTIPFTLSWSLIQAMSTGCLVLGSDTAPVRDAITHNENGILFPPRDIEAIEAAMLEALDAADNPTHPFHTLRKAARQTVVDEFSLDVCLPKLADFYLGSRSTCAPGSCST